ncbi:MAG: M15 family metallopeptidase [Bacilli bacterium]
MFYKNTKNKRILIISIIAIISILSIFFGYKYYKYRTSTTYKLNEIGYNKEEIKIIINKNKGINIALKQYHKNFSKIITSKYFMLNRLERYLDYNNKHKEIDIPTIISIVNTNCDKDFYTDPKTASGNDYLILANKYNQLEKGFIPNDLVDISIQYAYNGHQIRKDVNNEYIRMAKEAKKQGLTLIVNSSFRLYEKQEEIYNSFVRKNGKEEADKQAARPGFSEHQTGLALDLSTKLKENQTFENTEEFIWLKDNSYKFGFILRYPKGLENITGYQYEPWHYRYVGTEVAKIIHDENITFDEYYAFYLENNIK